MERKTKLGTLLATAGGVLTIAVSTKPQEATSNLAAWFKLLGADEVAAALPTQIDAFAGPVAIAAFLVGLAWALLPTKKPADQAQTPVRNPAINHRSEHYDASVATAIQHVASAIGERDTKGLFPQARKAIRQAALNGDIALKARRQLKPTQQLDMRFSDVLSPIEPAYWKSRLVGPMALIDPISPGADMWEQHPHTQVESPSNTDSDHEDHCYDLRADMNQVEKLWPLGNASALEMVDSNGPSPVVHVLSDPAKRAAIDEIYAALEDAEHIYDYGCDVIAGPWRDEILKNGSKAYIRKVEAYKHDVSAAIKKIGDLCERRFSRFAEIHAYRESDFGFQNDVFEPIEKFQDNLKKLPEKCDSNLLDLLATDAETLKKAIAAFGTWVRNSKLKFRQMRIGM